MNNNYNKNDNKKKMLEEHNDFLLSLIISK